MSCHPLRHPTAPLPNCGNEDPVIATWALNPLWDVVHDRIWDLSNHESFIFRMIPNSVEACSLPSGLSLRANLRMPFHLSPHLPTLPSEQAQSGINSHVTKSQHCFDTSGYDKKKSLLHGSYLHYCWATLCRDATEDGRPRRATVRKVGVTGCEAVIQSNISD